MSSNATTRSSLYTIRASISPLAIMQKMQSSTCVSLTPSWRRAGGALEGRVHVGRRSRVLDRGHLSHEGRHALLGVHELGLAGAQEGDPALVARETLLEIQLASLECRDDGLELAQRL